MSKNKIILEQYIKFMSFEIWLKFTKKTIFRKTASGPKIVVLKNWRMESLLHRGNLS